VIVFDYTPTKLGGWNSQLLQNGGKLDGMMNPQRNAMLNHSSKKEDVEVFRV
jgi:hypothetical protein